MRGEIIPFNCAAYTNFIPKHGRNRTLDVVCDTLENINLPDTGIHYSKPNLSKNEQNALKDLRNDRRIIIKEADKGGGVVIMDRDFMKTKFQPCYKTQIFTFGLAKHKKIRPCQK